MPQSFQRSRSCLRTTGFHIRLAQPESSLGLGQRDDRQIGNAVLDLPETFAGYSASNEYSMPLWSLRQQRRILARLGLTGVGELRVVARELAVVQLRREL